MDSPLFNRKTILSLIAGGIVSGAAFWLAFRKVPAQALFTYLAAIEWIWIIPTMILVMVIFALRSLRWQIIVNAAELISFKDAYHPLMIGFMLNSILPGRVGEVARPAILKNQKGVPFSTGLATVAVERMFDTGVLILLFLVVAATVEIDPLLEIPFGEYRLNKETLEMIAGGMVKLSLLLLFGMILFSIEPVRRLGNRLILKLPALLFFAPDHFKKRIEDRVCRPLIRFTDNIASGFVLLKRPGRVLACIGLSLLIWPMHAYGYLLLMYGSPGVNLTFFEMSAVMVIICFFIALPSVPGYWGLWEAGGIFAMRLFGVAPEPAAGYTLANHFVQMFPVFVAGLISAWLIGFSMKNASAAPPQEAQAQALQSR